MPTETMRGGLLSVKTNGEVMDALGDWEYCLSGDEREAIVGADRVHGFKSKPKVVYISGQITDRKSMDVHALLNLEDATITIEKKGGKTILLSNGWCCNNGKISTETGAIDVRFEGLRCEEV